MLVYRSTTEVVDVQSALDELRESVEDLFATRIIDHDALRFLLIRAGALEAALLDAGAPEEDEWREIDVATTALMRLLAANLVRSWAGDGAPNAGLAAAFGRLAQRAPRGLIALSRPEGFAFYGLFPETYISAAGEMIRSCAPTRAAVIGIRSIGTTLSAVVGAALERHGIPTTRLTVRPRGHPFERELRLGRHLTSELRRLANDTSLHFLIVDEGPGLSGSSFASVAESLAALGVPDERVVFLPSWNAPVSALSSDRARQHWSRHSRFVGEFDRDWIGSGRLGRRFGGRIVADLSAGAWRARLYSSAAEFPPAQTQHERRKFLLASSDGERRLLKFEGFGSLGVPRRDRAERLAAGGFTPPSIDFGNGFVATEWSRGRPLEPRDVDRPFIRHIARYLAWLWRRERASASCDVHALREVLEVNVREGLGDRWSFAARQLSAFAASVERMPAVRLDGRMQPYEWLLDDGRFMKTDALSHHDDHFYPGTHDIAWDLAGAVVELGLDREGERLLLREYMASSGDRGLDARLRFMRPAYLAFRLGYATLASQALAGSPDGNRMQREVARYREALRHELVPWIEATLECVEGGQSYAADT